MSYERGERMLLADILDCTVYRTIQYPISSRMVSKSINDHRLPEETLVFFCYRPIIESVTNVNVLGDFIGSYKTSNDNEELFSMIQSC